jgi:hypothetical protein
MKKTQGGIMNKVIIAAIIVFIAAVVAGVVLMSGRDKSPDTQTNTSANSSLEGKKACELIDLEEAKSLLGDNAVLLEGSGSDNLATTADVTVDNCSYSADGATLGDLKQMTIQVHTGDKTSVKSAYESFKKEYPGEDLSGLGDASYVTSESGQVSVLKGNSWFFVFGGSINNGAAANKELAVQAANIALKNL